MSLCLILFYFVRWLDKYKKLSPLIKDRGEAPFHIEIQSHPLPPPWAVIPPPCVNCKALLEMLWEKDARSHAVRFCARMLLSFILMQQLLYSSVALSEETDEEEDDEDYTDYSHVSLLLTG